MIASMAASIHTGPPAAAEDAESEEPVEEIVEDVWLDEETGLSHEIDVLETTTDGSGEVVTQVIPDQRSFTPSLRQPSGK